jgi:hypothetical protein
MTTKVTPETEVADSEMINENTDEYVYRCPHCDTIYADERHTRVHITRADDAAHRHRNGFMPEEEIEVIDADGEVIDTRSRRPEEVDLTDVTIDDFPADLSHKRKHALVVATRHPEADTLRELTDMVRERIENSDWEISPPSKPTVSRALDEYYHLDESDEVSTESEEKTLADLTLIQQAAIIGKLVLPDEPDTSIADRIGCACSYPGQISDEKEHVLTPLQTRLEQGDDIEAVLTDELTADTLAALIDKEFLSEIPLDVQSLAAEMDVDEASSTGLLATIVEETDPKTSSDSNWGSPVDHTSGMHAVPDDPFGSTNGDPADSDGLNSQSSDADLDSTDDIGADETQPDDLPAPAVVTEIAALKQKVAFFRQTINPVSQTDEQMALLESFAEQIEQSCEAMLDAADHT